MNANSTPWFNTPGDTATDSGHTALRIDQMQCLNLRERNVTCKRCADTCSAKALELTADEVRLDAGRCTACGACLPVCPSGALWLSGFDPRQFLQTVGAAEIHIHCSRSDDPDGGNIVPCLQVLDARLVAAAAAEGAQTVVLHGTARCSSCDRGDARAAVEQMHADLKRWFTDAPARLIQESRAQTGTGARLRGDQVQFSRRSFLRRFAGAHTAHGASKSFVDAARKQDEVTSRWPIFPSDGGSSRPSAYQELLAERAESLPWRDHQLPWRSRMLNDACSACLACAQRCPTGALVSEETESTISIWFDLRQCTDCGLCERLCPEGAISYASVARPEELRAPPHRVIHRSLRQCADCARGFVPGSGAGELCTICQNEHDVESDWKAMLVESSKATILPH